MRLPLITARIANSVKIVALNDNNELCVLEINCSHETRGVCDSCDTCSAHNESNTALSARSVHCPQRITLGIDTAPGGFATHVLAPSNGVHRVPAALSLRCAALCEPFAAALQAVVRTPLRQGERVCVLGARRLGLLIVAALKNAAECNFHLTAIARQDLSVLAVQLGADSVVVDAERESQTGQFDVVFDASGSASGFERAVRICDRILHLKSTCGQTVFGINGWTKLVVDEISLCAFSNDALRAAAWPRDSAHALSIGFSGAFSESRKHEIHEELKQSGFAIETQRMPCELMLCASLAEVDTVLRGFDRHRGFVRPRGVIAVDLKSPAGNQLESALLRGVVIHTSRCGNMKLALDVLAQNAELQRTLESGFITHSFMLDQMNEAFRTARSREAIKVLVFADTSAI
jgi:threonine dehydrogenase-like Zn-dependent dehydrogenase